MIIYTPDAGGPLWKVNADGSGAGPLTDKVFVNLELRIVGPFFCLMEITSCFFAASSPTLTEDPISGIYITSLAAKKKRC